MWHCCLQNIIMLRWIAVAEHLNVTSVVYCAYTCLTLFGAKQVYKAERTRQWWLASYVQHHGWWTVIRFIVHFHMMSFFLMSFTWNFISSSLCESCQFSVTSILRVSLPFCWCFCRVDSGRLLSPPWPPAVSSDVRSCCPLVDLAWKASKGFKRYCSHHQSQNHTLAPHCHLHMAPHDLHSLIFTDAKEIYFNVILISQHTCNWSSSDHVDKIIF